MVLAGAVAGSITAAATAVGAAGTLNGKLFLPEPVVWIIIPKTNNWERTFFGSMVHTTSSCTLPFKMFGPFWSVWCKWP